MKVIIENFRAVKRAEFETGPVNLICGDNYQGKTSTAQAIGACLSGETMPLPGLTKKKLSRLVHSGTAECSITCRYSENDYSKLMYPEANKTSMGKPPVSDVYSVGLKDIFKLKPEERTTYLAELLEAFPAKEDLYKEMRRIGLQEAHIKPVWETIDEMGWDAAHKHAKEAGSRLKGGWENITGQSYGIRKADSWFPEKWTPDLEDKTLDELTKDIVDAEQWLESAIKSEAIEENELVKLKELVDSEPALKLNYEERLKELATHEKIKVELDKWIEENPSHESIILSCPHCQGKCEVSGTGHLVKTVPRKADDKAIEKKEREAKENRAIIQSVKRSCEMILEKLNTCNEAAETLKKPRQENVEAEEKIKEMRLKLELGTERRGAKTSLNNANDKIKLLKMNIEIIKILEPAGLRRACIKTALTKFNDRADALCKTGSWERLELTETLDFKFNGMPLLFCSESEEFRARIISQIIISELNGSHFIIIDRADMLGYSGRNGLFNILAGIKISSIVFMTVSEGEKVPNLSSIDGKVFRITKGKLEEINGS